MCFYDIKLKNMIGDDFTKNEYDDKSITGLMFYYYWICKRKLWYFYNEIKMEDDNENVIIGKIIDENSYKREDKHINIDDVINIDFIKESKVLHEVKKSRKIENASVWQVKYYIYYLKKRGITGVKGEIDYPLLHQTLNVELNDEDEKIIEKAIDEIYEIVSKSEPIEYTKKNICKSCAYYDLCAI